MEHLISGNTKMNNTLIDAATIEKMVDYAKDIASHNQITLDLSKDSISHLAGLLNLIHDEYTLEEVHNEQSLSGICLSLGIYIGECMRKGLNSPDILWWHGVPSGGGDATAFLKMGENEVYPIDWVAKQITMGSSQSVDKKFKVHLKKLKRIG